jgi:hypothetical protein
LVGAPNSRNNQPFPGGINFISCRRRPLAL